MGSASSTQIPDPNAHVQHPKLEAVAEQQRKARTEGEEAHPSLAEYMALGTKHNPAPLPPTEEYRQDCLCNMNLLDTEPEERFDDITNLISEVFMTPIALVSIVDAERQWFKSVVGLPVRQTPRTESFCAWTLVNHVAQVLVVDDACDDIRFVNNSLVTGPPEIRFYGGCPIITQAGHRLGSLCVIDRKPRNITSESCLFLANMADIVAREIEDPRGKVVNTTPVVILNTSTEELVVQYVNSSFLTTCQVAKKDAVGKSVWSHDLFRICTTSEGSDSTKAEVHEAIRGMKDCWVEVESPGVTKIFKLKFRSATTDCLFDDSYIVGAPVRVNEENAPGYEKNIAKDLVFGILELIDERAAGLDDHPVHYSDKKVPQDMQLGMPIGKGSYGTVYRGRWTGIEVAVKVMPGEAEIEEDGYSPLGEAKLLQSLSHPNLVTGYHYIEHTQPDGRSEIWICQELCQLGTLASAYQNGFFRKKTQNWALDMNKILKVAYQVASAMAYVHSMNIVHSDLTSNNVLLQSAQGGGFICKLSDFGIARQLEPNQDGIVTEDHGTVTHMAPELLMDCKLSYPADVYSFGMVLWEIYHSRRPFEGMLHAQIIAQVALRNMRPELAEDIPGQFAAIIEECWTSEDDERPTFDELKERLKVLCDMDW